MPEAELAADKVSPARADFNVGDYVWTRFAASEAGR